MISMALSTFRSQLALFFLFSCSHVLASEQQPFEFGEMSASQFSLPPLPYSYDVSSHNMSFYSILMIVKALEPHISAQIMELHHSKHHQAYITNLNAALKAQTEAVHTLDITSQVALQQNIKFNAGGHINHSLFWQNLAPASSPETKTSAAPELIKQIKEVWGSEEKFIEAFTAALLSIQGSGWGWLIKIETGKQQRLAIVTTKDQDPIVGKGESPVIGVDLWEHSFYLQVRF